MKPRTKTPRREHPFGDFYEVLIERFPQFRKGPKTLDVLAFSEFLGFSPETVYRALRESEPLKLKVALRIIESSHSGGESVPMYWSDMLLYALPEYEEYAEPPEGVGVDDLLS